MNCQKLKDYINQCSNYIKWSGKYLDRLNNMTDENSYIVHTQFVDKLQQYLNELIVSKDKIYVLKNIMIDYPNLINQSHINTAVQYNNYEAVEILLNRYRFANNFKASYFSPTYNLDMIKLFLEHDYIINIDQILITNIPLKIVILVLHEKNVNAIFTLACIGSRLDIINYILKYVEGFDIYFNNGAVVKYVQDKKNIMDLFMNYNKLVVDHQIKHS